MAFVIDQKVKASKELVYGPVKTIAKGTKGTIKEVLDNKYEVRFEDDTEDRQADDDDLEAV